eukprot:TRINITY_DN220_c0_g1_i2.p1 TRINITY_DN220_c0_g1~~TRINITY_DN220_c0_g1_i2.p1  ORF type:complete len:130 (-),score=2.44 TRINITY_DN220_c0_g1_i2:27-416(-)
MDPSCTWTTLRVRQNKAENKVLKKTRGKMDSESIGNGGESCPCDNETDCVEATTVCECYSDLMANSIHDEHCLQTANKSKKCDFLLCGDQGEKCKKNGERKKKRRNAEKWKEKKQECSHDYVSFDSVCL